MLKKPFNEMYDFSKCSKMLPLLNTFRTFDWSIISKELEQFNEFLEKKQEFLAVGV